jgi:hypothetical protein
MSFEGLREIVLHPGSEIGELVNLASLWTLAVGSAWLVALFVLSAYEWCNVFTVRSRAQRKRAAIERAKSAGDVQALGNELLRHVPRFSVAGHRVRQLIDLRGKAGGAVESLSATDAEISEARLSLPLFLVNVPIMLGLAGTLWGLASAVAEIQPLVRQIKDLQDLPSLLAAMSQTLAGMETAFSTSIVGLLASLLLSMVGALASWISAVTLNSLDRATTSTLVPLLALPEWQSAATIFAEAMTASTGTLQQVSASMSSWTAKLNEALERSSDAGKQLQSGAQALQHSATEIAGYRGSFEAAVSRAGHAIGAVAQAAESINGSLAAVQSKGEAGLDRQEFAEALRKMKDGLGNVVSEVHAIAQGTPERYAQALQAVRDESKQDLVGLFDHVEDGFAERLASLHGTTAQLLAGLEANQQKLDQVLSVMIAGSGVRSRPAAGGDGVGHVDGADGVAHGADRRASKSSWGLFRGKQ